MKGVVFFCVKEHVLSKFGERAWKDIVKQSGIKNSSFLAGANVNDSEFFKLLKNCREVLEIDDNTLMEGFAVHWIHGFAAKTYKNFFDNASNAKEFIKSLDYVHEVMTNSIPDSSPPRYDLDWKSPTEVVVTYKSTRGLVGLAAKLLREVGVYYKEDLDVTHDGVNKITVAFTY